MLIWNQKCCSGGDFLGGEKCVTADAVLIPIPTAHARAITVVSLDIGVSSKNLHKTVHLPDMCKLFVSVIQ